MAITKLNWYLGVFFVVAVLGLSFMIFGQNMLVHNKANLNDESVEYIGDYSGYVQEAEFDTLNESTDDARQESLTGQSNETERSTIEDVLAGINFYSTRVGKITGTLKLIYNAPTFFVLSLGLPLEPFRHVINIIGNIIAVALIILVVSLIRGSKGT